MFDINNDQKTPSTGENMSTKNFSSSFEQIGSDLPANL